MPPNPPRVLLVIPDQWPRALLRAALRELGYDAVGTRALGTALRVPASDPIRGPVRLVVIDQQAFSEGGSGAAFTRLLARHGAPATVLLARPSVKLPDGPWHRVLERPMSIGDIVAAIEALLPLPAADRQPLD